MNEGHRWQRGDTMLVRNVRDRKVRYWRPDPEWGPVELAPGWDVIFDGR